LFIIYHFTFFFIFILILFIHFICPALTGTALCLTGALAVRWVVYTSMGVSTVEEFAGTLTSTALHCTAFGAFTLWLMPRSCRGHHNFTTLCSLLHSIN
jgi:hypothetical protein